MNADGKIYIIVTDRLPGGTSPVPEPQEPEGSGSGGGNGSTMLHWARSRMLNTVKSAAIGAASYAISNIGNFTGDYEAQADVQNAISAVRSFVSIGMSAMAGFKMGGPWGAVIGASLELANQGVNYVGTQISMHIQNQKTNYSLEQLRNRSGLNALKDGSRGTEG